MDKLKFYDMKGKVSFETGEYKFENKGNRRFAVAKAPSGVKAYRIVKKE